MIEKHQQLLRRYEKESKANKRLSMDNEELMYRLTETEDLLLSPSTDGLTGANLRAGRSPDGQSPDFLARRFCRSPHDGATNHNQTAALSSSLPTAASGIPSPHAVTRRVRTSSTSSYSSEADKRSSGISMRSEDETKGS